MNQWSRHLSRKTVESFASRCRESGQSRLAWYVITTDLTDLLNMGHGHMSHALLKRWNLEYDRRARAVLAGGFAPPPHYRSGDDPLARRPAGVLWRFTGIPGFRPLVRELCGLRHALMRSVGDDGLTDHSFAAWRADYDRALETEGIKP